MGKRKLSQKGLILIAGTVAGCVAGTVSYASTPPPAPSVPTAPALPAFQMLTTPASIGSNATSGAGTYSPLRHFPVLPANSYVLGYLPNGTSYVESATVYSYAGATEDSLSSLTLVTSTSSSGSPSVSQTSSTVPNPVDSAATVGILLAGPSLDPLSLTQEVTVADGTGAYASGGYGYINNSSYNDLGQPIQPYAHGALVVGNAGYSWLQIASAGILNTLGTPSIAPAPVLSLGGRSAASYAGGVFIGTTLERGGAGFYSYSGYQYSFSGYYVPSGGGEIPQNVNFGGPATGYGVVNVNGGTWNDSNSPIYVGYGGHGFITVQSAGSVNITNQALILGQDSTGLPTTVTPPGSSQSYALPHLAAGIGAMVVKSGGKLTISGTGGYVALGRSVSSSGATGNLYVTGIGTTASVSQGILIGDGGYGFFAVLSGGQVTSGSSYAAGGAKTYGVTTQPGSGNIVIDGVSSSWTISGTADFGESGVATATVQNHGDLNISGTLTLGDQSTGSGTLTVQADGTVESGDATLGNQAGATGFANVSNINTLWTVDGDLTIGNSGQGTLTLSNNGEVVTTGAGILGSQAGSTGSATITDAGTEWQINGDLKVGDKGNATMQVENGGYVSLAGNLDIADGGGTSTLTLDGANSRMIAGGTSVTIGGQGDGTLMVQNAADAVFSGASVSLGEKSSGTGTLTVEGSNTIMSTGSLTIGGYGTGTVNVQDSAALSTATNISLGEQASGIGTATIDSASVTDAGTLTVGGYGTGTMSIQNSGSLTVQGNSVTLGEQAGSSGTLNIIGNGSSLIFSGDLTVGESGSGDFELQNGGQFGGVSMTVGAGSGFGGASTGGAGTVEISGAGSSLSLSQDLTVGKYGQGTITLAGGGSLIDQGDVTLGSVTASNGTVNVNTGSIWMLSGGLTIGSKGYGTVVVNGASNLKSTGDSITVGKQGAGELTVSGNQSLLTYTGDLAIGDEATGTLNVQSGAGIQYSGNTSNVDIAETAGITGTVTVTDSGSTMAADNLVLAGKSSGSGGNGILNVENGGILTVANDMTMWKNASLNVTGGSITVGTVGSGTAPLNTLQVNTSGNLAAGGTLTGNLVNNQGVIALGKILPESLNITGGFSQSGGTLKVLIAGSSDFSQLNATGAVNISGGTIEFDFINGFAPKSGETFQFLDPPQAVNLANTAYTFTGLASGFTFGVNSDANGLLFTALSNGVPTTSPIPEPATLALLAMAGTGIKLLRKRRGFVKR